MSQLELVYAKLVELIGAELLDHTRLPNPYKLEENGNAFLLKGWGITMGPASNQNRVVGCGTLHEQRNFTIPLTRKYSAREDDVTAKATTEVELHSVAYIVKKLIEGNPQLDGIATSASFTDDTGTNYVFADKDRFLTTELTFSIEYVELLT